VGPLGTALADCAAAGFTGALSVIGAPGGTIHLTDGSITTIETSWSPSAEVILLHSGRVLEADWEAAFVAATVARGHLSAELVGRGLVGAGELEALLRIALADAMFAFAAGFVDHCRTDVSPPEHALPLEPAADAGWLVAEALRRVQVLAAFPDPPLRPRERVAAVPGAVGPGVILGGGRDEVLALADGRRTTRDIAFALGRGLYVTMLQLARMRAEGLIEPGIAPGSGAEDHAGGTGAGETTMELPRRQKGRPVEPPRSGNLPSRSLPVALRLLRPRSGDTPRL
jgi:hypothetical protein